MKHLIALSSLTCLLAYSSGFLGGGGGAGTLTTLNGLTADPQLFATGTSGNDFAISSASDTHTFNLPNASATARGVVSTGSQTLAGAKTFSSLVTASAGISATAPAGTPGVTILAPDADETVLTTKSSTTTGVIRQSYENSDATTNFNFAVNLNGASGAFNINRLLGGSGRTLGIIDMDGDWTIGSSGIGNTHTVNGTITMADLTASKPVCTDGSKVLSSTCTDLIPYASLDATNNYRVLSTNGSATVIESAAITASRALISDANGIPTHSTVTSTQLSGLLVEDISGHIESLSNKTYYLRLNASYASTVNSITVDCASGTADGELQIDGTPVTGCADANIDFTSTEETETCSAANSISAGNDLTLVVTDNATALDCRFTVKLTRS